MPAPSDPITLALRPSTKSSRTASIVRDAINAGKPLPLAVMLEQMWKFRDEAIRLEVDDPLLARQYRLAAMNAAKDAAPYVHPRLANVAVRPEDELEAQERRAVSRSIADQVEGKNVKELGKLWLAVARGEKIEQTGVEIDAEGPVEADSLDPPVETFDDEEAPHEPC
jgi:hypothetical protein